MRWTLCCRVVDNFGDVGFAWRLAADLASRGEAVRLAIDDASALAWMTADDAAGVDVVDWRAASATPSDVLVELLGGGVPAGAAGAAALRINVEHLSGESFVVRSHGLPRGVPPDVTWYYFPGFVEGTGGLLREPRLLQRRRDFGDGTAWLAARGIDARPGERRVSLFCYDNDALPALIGGLADTPTLLLATAGQGARQVQALLGPSMRRGAVRAVSMPFLSQDDYDRLLWSCDLNLVRGEDSLVRAIWAGAPFLWQLYRQDDGAHLAKLEALLAHMLAAADEDLAVHVHAAFARWNGAAGNAPFALPSFAPWQRLVTAWREGLAVQPDLTSGLIEFARSKR